ncbi:MAG TPA: right-handed parallel beta-helix repeat-containing protein [Candidatus Saccharimonadales bacterium]|nr:right-handed parallel beta-helix repeat-containing protein [Candidatus Saccharimonadales bacterium]
MNRLLYKMSWQNLAAFLVLLALPPSATPQGFQKTYFVDSRNGSDTNNGTSPASAWKSLAKVNARTFLPGDHIRLKSGSVWRGQLWPKGSGTEQRPITLGMYGGGVRPRIQGAGLAEDAMLLKNQEYWEISDLDITNWGAKAAVRRGVHVALENFGEAHHIYLRSLVVHDVNGSDEMKPNGGIHYTSSGERRPSRFIDLRIEDSEIYHVDRSGIFGWSDAYVRTKWYPSLGVVVRGNNLHDIGGDGIVVVATDGALVEHNVVGRANQRSQGYNVAIWSWSADNTVIQFNEAYGTKGQRDGEGFDSDWNSRNTLIQYNYSHDNDGGFVLICNEGSQPAEQSIGNSGTVVRYNISQNDRTRGITISGPVKDSQIYNNTIYTGPDRDVNVVLFSDWAGWASDTEFSNNIFYAKGTAQISYGTSRAADGEYVVKAGFGLSEKSVFDSNVYFGVANPPEDAAGLLVEPEFAAPGAGRLGRSSLHGYVLQAGAKASAGGKKIANRGEQDFFGTTLVRCGAVNRGAVQSTECK